MKCTKINHYYIYSCDEFNSKKLHKFTCNKHPKQSKRPFETKL